MRKVANDNVCPHKQGAIARFISEMVRARRARKATREMLSLGDHILRDIGLSRFDVMVAMRGPRGGCCDRLRQLADENRRSQPGVRAAELLSNGADEKTIHRMAA